MISNFDAAFNSDAERQLIGSVLTAPDRLSDVLMVEGEWFVDEQLGRLWDHLRAFSSDGDWWDPLLLYRSLPSEFRGSGLLPRLVLENAVSSHIRHYAKLIEESHKRRQLALLRDQLDSAADSEADAAVIARKIAAMAGEIAGDEEEERGGMIGDLVQRAIEDNVNEGARSHLKAWSGIRHVDEAIGPMVLGGECGIVAARPGHGKTAFGVQFGMHNARRGLRTLFISLEMPPLELAEREIASAAEFSATAFRRGRLGKKLVHDAVGCYQDFHEVPLEIHNPTSATIDSIRSLVLRKQPELVIVDHLGEVAPSRADRSKSKYEQVSETASSLRRLVNEVAVPFLVLVQLNRSANEQRPTMASLRDSGRIEEIAHSIMFIHRESDQETNANCKFIFAKGRGFGTSTLPVIWEPEKTRFSTSEPERDVRRHEAFDNFNNGGGAF